jgi:hypothetical protein
LQTGGPFYEVKSKDFKMAETKETGHGSAEVEQTLEVENLFAIKCI